MANPNPTPPPKDGQFKEGNKANPGGRTPTAWLRKLLDAAHDKGPDAKTHREAIALHLIEVATTWKVVVKGRGENAIEVADAGDSIEAAKVLYAYDMGKPVESLEVTENQTGSRTLLYLPVKGSLNQPPASQASDPTKDPGPSDGSPSASGT